MKELKLSNIVFFVVLLVYGCSNTQKENQANLIRNDFVVKTADGRVVLSGNLDSNSLPSGIWNFYSENDKLSFVVNMNELENGNVYLDIKDATCEKLIFNRQINNGLISQEVNYYKFLLENQNAKLGEFIFNSSCNNCHFLNQSWDAPSLRALKEKSNQTENNSSLFDSKQDEHANLCLTNQDVQAVINYIKTVDFRVENSQ